MQAPTCVVRLLAIAGFLAGGLLTTSCATVTPIPAGSLATTRLLREGDAFGDWWLHSIDAHVAVFRVNGLRVRVAVP